MGEPRVSILMGSTSDKEVMDEAKSVLKKFGIDYEVKVISAHRTPKMLHEISHRSHHPGTVPAIRTAIAAASSAVGGSQEKGEIACHDSTAHYLARLAPLPRGEARHCLEEWLMCGDGILEYKCM